MGDEPMRRRRLIVVAVIVLLAGPLVARAQQPPRIARIGYLGFGSPAESATRVEAFRAGLRDLGYVEGKNIVIEFRWASTVAQLNEAAADFVRMNVDVIFATSSTESEPARRATSTIPIVFATHADPQSAGHVASLARPGGNMTGLADIQTVITPKRLELLKATVPHATRIGVLWTPTAPSGRPFVQAAEDTGAKLGLQLLTVSVSSVGEFDAAFARMAKSRAGGVLVHGAALTGRVNRTLLAETALRHHLPTMFGLRENVLAGGLMSYGPDHHDLTRRAVVYIDKVLRGAKPADLPVEQASKYLLVINRKTASALGLTIPPSILARADEIIE